MIVVSIRRRGYDTAVLQIGGKLNGLRRTARVNSKSSALSNHRQDKHRKRINAIWLKSIAKSPTRRRTTRCMGHGCAGCTSLTLGRTVDAALTVLRDRESGDDVDVADRDLLHKVSVLREDLHARALVAAVTHDVLASLTDDGHLAWVPQLTLLAPCTDAPPRLTPLQTNSTAAIQLIHKH